MQIFCNALVASLPFSLCLLGLAVLVYLFFKRQVIQPLQGILQQTPVELPQQTENELALLCHAREQLVQQTNSHASMLARMRPEIITRPSLACCAVTHLIRRRRRRCSLT